MTPLQIEILLHFYCSGSPYVHGEMNTYPEVIVEFLQWAANDGNLIERDPQLRSSYENSIFSLTPRGKAYIERLLSTPLPRKVETWVFDGVEA